MSNARGADLGLVTGAGSDTTATHFKGAWVSGAYSQNDQVTNAYGLYQALTAVSSSIGAPSTSPAYPDPNAVFGSVDNGTTDNGRNAGNYMYYAFTTGATAGQVSSITFPLDASSTSGGPATIGIATSVGANPSQVVWLGATPGTTTVPGTTASGYQGFVTAYLPVALTLAASTTYYVVGLGNCQALSTNNSPATVQGKVASVAADSYFSSGLTTGWGVFTGYHGVFKLSSGSLSYWTKLANLGADPANIVPSAGADTSAEHYQGAWSTTPAYNKNDVVTRAYSLYTALSAVPANQDPIAGIGTAAVVATNQTTGTTGGGQTSLDQWFTVTNAVQVNTVTSPGIAGTGVAAELSIQGGAVLGTSPTQTIGTLAAGSFPLGTTVTLSPGVTYRLRFFATSGLTVTQTTSQAGQVNITPVAGGYYNATTNIVFSLLGSLLYWQKIANTGNQENVGQVAASSTAVTIADPEIQSITRIVLTANCTVTLPPVVAGKSFNITLVQDATGSRTVTFAGGAVIWPGGTAPTLTTTANKADVLSFMADGSANWIGFVAGQNY